MNDKDKIITNGYIRDWLNNDNNMKDIRHPPIYLIKIIQTYFCDNNIHLFSSSNKIDILK